MRPPHFHPACGCLLHPGQSQGKAGWKSRKTLEESIQMWQNGVGKGTNVSLRFSQRPRGLMQGAGVTVLRGTKL